MDEKGGMKEKEMYERHLEMNISLILIFISIFNAFF